MKKITVMLIDDERNARQELKELLKDYPEFEIIGEAANADEAKITIELKRPELLFLDIQMPEKTGFELLESLNHVPEVIFCTAFDHYAVKAFEVSALDYLMKPVRSERFLKAITQAKAKLSIEDSGPRIFVKDRQEYHLISWNKVHLIESMDNYARLFFDTKNVFLKSSLNELENKLGNNLFFRINRAQLVNLTYVGQISISVGSRLKFTLLNGDELEVSDRQSVKFRKLHPINS